MSYDEEHRFFLYDGFSALCATIAIASVIYANYDNAFAAGFAALAVVSLRHFVAKPADPHGHH